MLLQTMNNKIISNQNNNFQIASFKEVSLIHKMFHLLDIDREAIEVVSISLEVIQALNKMSNN